MSPRAARARPARDSSIVPPMVRSLFAVGRLAEENFVARLLERPVAASAVELLDFEALVPSGFGDLVIFAAEGSRVAGKLYRHVSDQDFERLDAYQGLGEELYFRDLGRVVRPGGDAIDAEEAWVYLPSERTVARFGGARGRPE
jgi:hypothetical protein